MGTDFWCENFAFNPTNFNQFQQLVYTKLVNVAGSIGYLSFMEPKSDNFPKASISSKGKVVRVATKYPNIVAKYAKEQVEQLEIIRSGSVEAMLKLGLCDVICDFVQTGKTLEDNGLQTIPVSVLGSLVYLGGVYKKDLGL